MLSSRSKLSRFVTLIAGGICALGLLLAGATAYAATVEKDGDVATAIRGLKIGSATYDVEFTCLVSTVETYGLEPDFDVNDPTSGETLLNATLDELNRDMGVGAVGCGAAEGEFNYTFKIAWRLEELEIDLPDPGPNPDPGKLEVPILLICNGARSSGDTNVWLAINDGEVCFDSVVHGTNQVVPRYTVAGTGGPGNQSPVADAGGPYSGAVGSPVQFDGSGSDDLDGSISSYAWNFGDGGTSTLEQPMHTYGSAGDFNVTLTVTDDSGTSASDNAQASIGQAGAPPEADAGGPYNASTGSPITLDGSGSKDPDGSISSYSWDMDDANTRKGKKPQHTYDADGKYSVTLTVTNEDGETDTDTTTVTSASGNQAPTADAGGAYARDTGVAVQFEGGGSSDPDGSIASYLWLFEDGTTLKGKRPKRTFRTAGTYSVNLEVTDNEGLTDSDTARVTISD